MRRHFFKNDWNSRVGEVFFFPVNSIYCELNQLLNTLKEKNYLVVLVQEIVYQLKNNELVQEQIVPEDKLNYNMNIK